MKNVENKKKVQKNSENTVENSLFRLNYMWMISFMLQNHVNNLRFRHFRLRPANRSRLNTSCLIEPRQYFRHTSMRNLQMSRNVTRSHSIPTHFYDLLSCVFWQRPSIHIPSSQLVHSGDSVQTFFVLPFSFSRNIFFRRFESW